MEDNERQVILDTLREFSTPDRPVYLVGGAVRDALLGRPVHDLDFVLPGNTRRLAREISCRLNGALYTLDEERDTTRVVLEADSQRRERILLDFASLRSVNLEADLRDRDFSINAMALDVSAPERLIDPVGGLVDLREQRIRACSPTSFSRDPVRVLRAVRQALGLNFHIEPATLQWMREGSPFLLHTSAERLRDELFRMLEGPQVSLAIRLLDQIGALEFVLPELKALQGVTQTAPHIDDVWEHTLAVVNDLEAILPPLIGDYREETVADLTMGLAVLWLGRFRQPLAEHLNRPLVHDRSLTGLLFLAALYHDIGKPETRVHAPDGRVRFLDHPVVCAITVASRARALALSTAEVSRLETIVEQHMRVHQLSDMHKKKIEGEEKPSRRAIYRFFKDTGEAGVDMCLLSLADLRGTYGVTLPQDVWESELRTVRALLEAYWEKGEEVVAPPRYLNGNDLMQLFNLQPGHLLGQLLEAIREAQGAGEVHDREEAIVFARGWLQDQGVSGETSREKGER